MSKNLPLILLIIAGVSLVTWQATRNKTSHQAGNIAAENSEATVLSCRNLTGTTIQIDSHTFQAATTNTPEERRLGLGGCEQIPDKSGLFFPIDPPRESAFWMKGMLIPIDILWMKDEQVVGIEHSAQPPAPETPDDQLTIYEPPGLVDGVFEIPAGTAEQLNITTGSEVRVQE